MVLIANSPVESLGIYSDTFLSPMLVFKVILLYEFTAWTSKMLRDMKMILGCWWSDLGLDGDITSAESSFDSIQLGFVDLSEDFETV